MHHDLEGNEIVMVQTIDGNWLPVDQCRYVEELDAFEEDLGQEDLGEVGEGFSIKHGRLDDLDKITDDEEYPDWFREYLDEHYGIEDEEETSVSSTPNGQSSGYTGTGSGSSGSSGSGSGYSGYQGGGYQSCPHDGTSLDHAFDLGGLKFFGAKAAVVKSIPDFILDFADTTWSASDAQFIKSVKASSLASVEIEKALKDLEKYATPPLAIMTFKWADGGAPNCSFEFWDNLIPTMEQLLLENKGRKTGDVVLCCQGGHGRTGTGMAAILIVKGGMRVTEAVQLLRDDYCDSAVETQKQIDYLYWLEEVAHKTYTPAERSSMRKLVKRPNLDYVVRKKASKVVTPSTSSPSSSTPSTGSGLTSGGSAQADSKSGAEGSAVTGGSGSSGTATQPVGGPTGQGSTGGSSTPYSGAAGGGGGQAATPNGQAGTATPTSGGQVPSTTSGAIPSGVGASVLSPKATENKVEGSKTVKSGSTGGGAAESGPFRAESAGSPDPWLY